MLMMIDMLILMTLMFKNQKIENGNYDITFDLNEDGKLDNNDIEYFRNVMYDLGSRQRN